MSEGLKTPKDIFDLVIDGPRLVLSGRLHIDALQGLDRARARNMARGVKVIDMARLTRIDTAGAWFLVDLQRSGATGDRTIALEGASEPQTQLLETVRRNLPPEDIATIKPSLLADRLERIGRTVGAMAAILVNPRRLRLTSLVHHCQEVGLNAVPIVALMAFLIGVVLAFQGSAQLRQFGAEVFVVDLIAISVLRELGILLTAIIVAGRSGSAFTAAIGSMKMREEIDAMRTLGLDPVTILVVPRVLALMLMLPALGFIADISGLVGGAIMSWIELGVSPAVFQSRLVSNTDVWHFGIGMIKAPFFALIIGIIGCYEGMMVGGDAESLGRLTSASVVLSIFMVIVMDALFSVFFAVVGV